jgi:hypothetical protein
MNDSDDSLHSDSPKVTEPSTWGGDDSSDEVNR